MWEQLWRRARCGELNRAPSRYWEDWQLGAHSCLVPPPNHPGIALGWKKNHLAWGHAWLLGQPIANDWFMEVQEDPTFSPQSGATLQGCSSSWTPCGVGWSPRCACIAAHPLPGPTHASYTPSQTLMLRTDPKKPAASKSQSQSLIPRAPDSWYGAPWGTQEVRLSSGVWSWILCCLNDHGDPITVGLCSADHHLTTVAMTSPVFG